MSDAEQAEPEQPDAVWTITNEFTTIHVRKVFTRNGERLQLHSPKLGFTTELDPLELESLTWQPPETFSRLLETPYGPEGDTTDIRPLTELFDSSGAAGEADATTPGSGGGG